MADDIKTSNQNESKCLQCDATFLARDKRHKYCSKKCYVRFYSDNHTEEHKKRERERYYEKRPLRLRQVAEYRAKNKDEIHRKQRTKYHSDPILRAKMIEDSRKWREENPEQAAETHRRIWFRNHEENKKKQKENSYQERVQVPWKHLVKSAGDRAFKKSLPYDLTEQWGKGTVDWILRS